MAGTTAVRARWALIDDGQGARIQTDRWIVIKGEAIAAIADARPDGADVVIDRPDCLVVPGLMNLHNHGISALLFRGIAEDRPTASWASDTVYGLIMPLQGLAMEVLNSDELRAITALGFLGPLKSGATTVMDVFRLDQAVSFEVAAEMGFRLYGAPYIFSTEDLAIGADGLPVYAARAGRDSDLDRCLALHDTYDGGANGRLQVGFGPHGLDTCEPDLLAAIRDAASERGAKVTIHTSQSVPEGDTVRGRYGRSPAEQLDHVGLLGPDLLAAHCVYASADDLGLFARTGTTVVNCPSSFARGAVPAVWQRSKAMGIRTAIGLDGYAMDMVAEMRTAAIVSKLATGLSENAAARDLVGAMTIDSAAALGRPDLGRIAPGARADLVVFDMGGAHLAPVSDPLKTLVWHANAADVAAVIVDGAVIVEGGRHLLVDEAAIIEAGSAAVRKVWAEGLERGFIKPGEIV